VRVRPILAANSYPEGAALDGSPAARGGEPMGTECTGSKSVPPLAVSSQRMSGPRLGDAGDEPSARSADVRSVGAPRSDSHRMNTMIVTAAQ